MNVGVTFTGEEVFREKLDIASAKILLSPLDLSEVIEFCALLNAVNQISIYEVGGWKSVGGSEILERLLKDLLDPVYHQRARAVAQTSLPFAPLSGAAVNGLIGLACRWCANPGRPLTRIRYRRNVTRVLFALQGELIDKQKVVRIGDEDGLRQAFPYIARAVLSNKAVKMEHDLGRLHALVSRPEIDETLKKRVLQELPGEFSLGLFEGREGRSF